MYICICNYIIYLFHPPNTSSIHKKKRANKQTKLLLFFHQSSHGSGEQNGSPRDHHSRWKVEASTLRCRWVLGIRDFDTWVFTEWVDNGAMLQGLGSLERSIEILEKLRINADSMTDLHKCWVYIYIHITMIIHLVLVCDYIFHINVYIYICTHICFKHIRIHILYVPDCSNHHPLEGF